MRLALPVWLPGGHVFTFVRNPYKQLDAIEMWESTPTSALWIAPGSAPLGITNSQDFFAKLLLSRPLAISGRI